MKIKKILINILYITSFSFAINSCCCDALVYDFAKDNCECDENKGKPECTECDTCNQQITDEVYYTNIVNYLVSNNGYKLPGIVLFVKNGNSTFVKAGNNVLNPQYNFPNISTAQRFRIASVSKQFLAVLLLKLAEEGRLSLNQTIGYYLPWFPEPYRYSTVRSLLNHTSGLGDYDENPNFWSIPHCTYANPTFVWNQIDLIYNSVGPTFPGNHRYSNTNYVVAGLIAEEITDSLYNNLLKNRFFNKLQMNSTELQILPGSTNIAAGMFKDCSPPYNLFIAPECHPSAWRFAGGILATAIDLNKWQDALFRGQIIGTNSLSQLLTPYAPGGEYGLGIQIGSTNLGAVYYHTGLLVGYRTFSIYYSNWDLYVNIFLPYDDSVTPGYDLNTISGYILRQVESRVAGTTSDFIPKFENELEFKFNNKIQ